MAMALAAQKLSVEAYDGRALLADVELSVPPTGALRIAGRSGSGKTTLLRAVATLHPSRGRLSLGEGTPASLGTPRWRRRVTLVPQRPRLFGGDVEKNLRRSFGYASADAPYEPTRAASMLAAVDLPPDVLTREARTLSVGEQQRVCLVRGLLHRPAFVLLDEPTSALDPQSRDAVVALLERERAEGMGMILVSHDDLVLADLETLDLEPFRA